MADSKTSALFEVRAVGTEKASRQFTTFERTATGSMTRAEASVGKSLARIAAQYMSMAVGINKAMKLMSSGMEFNKFVENQTMAFTVMLKSAEKAKAQMEDLYNFAVKSPLTFKDTASAAKQLMAYGFAAKELVPTMDTLGTVALATGHSLGDIAYVYGTLRSQGRAYSRDLMQFGMRGIPIYEELAKVMGVNVQQIQKLTSQGKVGFKEVERAFQNMTSSGGRFSGMLEQYMDTLTGKLAMFEDIFEKSTGKIMRGATNSYKNFIDEMTSMLESTEMQEYFNELGMDIKSLADLFFTLAKGLVEVLPLLTKALKVFIAYKSISTATKLLKNLPETILNIGEALMLLSGKNLAGGFIAKLATSGHLFAEGLMMALPIMSQLAGIAALIAGPILAIKTVYDATQRDKAFEEDAQLAMESLIPIMREQLPTITSQVDKMGLSDMEREVELNTRLVGLISDYAARYKLANAEVAKMLYLNKMINGEVARMLGFDIAGHFAKVHADAAQAGARAYKSAMEREMAYFSSLTGKNEKLFYDPKDAHAFGRRAANLYIGTFKDTWDTEKLKWKDLFVDDKQKALLEEELKSLTEVYNAAFIEIGEVGMEKSGFGLRMRERIKQITDMLEEGFGKKLPELGDWWLPQESAVAASLSAVDDLQLAHAKAYASAQKEVEARRDALIINIKFAKNEQDRISYQIQLNNLIAEEAQIYRDIAKTHRRLIGIGMFNEATQGQSDYWNGVRARAGRAFNTGNTSAGIGGTIALGAEETESGSLAAGGNPFAVGTVALTSFITSIENVTALLNPLTTAFEAMRGMVEPLTNDALEPLVAIVEQVGEAFGKVLAPFLGLFQIVTSLAYGAFAPLLAAIDWVSGGFLWFFDYVIMPVGNVIIKAINAVIRVINMIPGVHIRYLKEIKRSTGALKDFAKAARNTQDSLKDTISYLHDKLSGIFDKQIDSLQDLYEVGAITATEYESQVKNLKSQMVFTQDALVSVADRQLETQEEILQRLLDLYKLQDAIDAGGLSDEQISKLLEDNGLTSKSLSRVMIDAITTALTNLGISRGGNTGGGNTGRDTVDVGIATAEILSHLENMFGNLKPYLIPAITNIPHLGDQVASFTKFFGEDLEKLKQVFATGDIVKIQNEYNRVLERWKKSLTKDALAEMKNWLDTYVNTARSVQDAIIAPNGNIITTAPDDYLIATKTPWSLGNKGGTNINVNVSVAGSVVAEKELAGSIASIIYNQRSRGILTV